MRTWMVLCAAVAVLVGAGCVYEAPVTAEHSIATDPAVLGLWEAQPKDGEPVDHTDRLLVLRYSPTEYLVEYPVGKDPMYFRGYAMTVDGLACVQLQLIGTAEGPAAEADRKYHVASYTLANGVLEIRTLNTDLVDKAITTSAGLAKAIHKNRDNKDLFHEPGRFKKVNLPK